MNAVLYMWEVFESHTASCPVVGFVSNSSFELLISAAIVSVQRVCVIVCNSWYFYNAVLSRWEIL